MRLDVRPWGEGRLTLDPPGRTEAGAPASATCDRDDAEFQNDFLAEWCTRYYAPGTQVTVTPAARPGGAFLGWSDHRCEGQGPCRLTLATAETSLLGRFSPMRLRLEVLGSGAGVVTSDPDGLRCTVTDRECVRSFPVGQPLTLIADRPPERVFWKGDGCVPAADGQRCAVSLAYDPHWVRVALNEDEDSPVAPAKLKVRFGIERQGEGRIRGRRIDCGPRCEERYDFGQTEQLTALPDPGWRLTEWSGGCERQQECTIVIGPITSVNAVFVRNVVPRLLGVSAAGTRAGRRLVVRLSVRADAQARVLVRREGAPRGLVDRRFPLRSGRNTLTVPLPRTAPAGTYRVVVAVSDGHGGGRTFTVLRRVGR